MKKVLIYSIIIFSIVPSLGCLKDDPPTPGTKTFFSRVSSGDLMVYIRDTCFYEGLNIYVGEDYWGYYSSVTNMYRDCFTGPYPYGDLRSAPVGINQIIAMNNDATRLWKGIAFVQADQCVSVSLDCNQQFGGNGFVGYDNSGTITLWVESFSCDNIGEVEIVLTGVSTSYSGKTYSTSEAYVHCTNYEKTGVRFDLQQGQYHLRADEVNGSRYWDEYINVSGYSCTTLRMFCL